MVNILNRYRETLIRKLDELLRGGPSPILDMCRYRMGLAEADGRPTSAGVGKMVRPAMCLAMYESLATEGPRGSLCPCPGDRAWARRREVQELHILLQQRALPAPGERPWWRRLWPGRG